MRLEPGSHLAHYEILELIGKGGMGEVYRAKDTRLPREVAIKTSFQKFSERFAREAKVIASLNHPNICTLFDVGPDYLVMELVEGPTLQERIKEGPVNLRDASTIAQQISDALEYAHEKGVIHRDLKPGNIKIRPDGVVKVLDFGLAKVAVAPASDPAEAATVTLGGTEAGVVLGTAAYMSPEQAMGKPVDRRADVFSFGVVFYEMLTGSRMHTGASVQEIMASVMKDEPDLSKVPPQARKLLARCLEKDPNRRLRHVGDVMALLEDAPVSGSQPAVAPEPAPAAAKKSVWFWPAFGVLMAAVAGIGLWAPWRSGGDTRSAVRFEVGPSAGMTFNAGAYMTISPDGRWMVFQANGEDGITRYWIRSIDGLDLRPLPGTENIGNVSPPAAWSHDSRWVIFSPLSEGKLKKVDIQGGPPQVLSDWPGGLNGASWNADGVIIGGSSRNGVPILKVSASGGQATPATVLKDGDSNHLWPQFLPDGKHFLYERVSADTAKAGVYIGSIDVKPEEQSAERLLASDRQAYFAAQPGMNAGHLIFLRSGTMMAQPFDPAAMKLSGEPAAIADQVDSYAPRNGGLFSVSGNGTLTYRTGTGPQALVSWFDATGKSIGTVGDLGDYGRPAVSPDGKRIAVTMVNGPGSDIWILDISRGTSTRFTFDPAIDDYPAWSPDGKNIAFVSRRGNQQDLYVGPADNPGQEKLLLHTDEPKDDLHWSSKGDFLLFSSVNSKTSRDMWALPLSDGAKPIGLLQTQFVERRGRVSPDGRWLAYESQESGSGEVYVRPMTTVPGAVAPKWLISKGGGFNPHWARDGRTLYYVGQGASSMMAVDVEGGAPFRASTPRRVFAAPAVAGLGWDIAPDGRFLFIAQPGPSRVIPFTVVLNWAEDVKK